MAKSRFDSDLDTLKSEGWLWFEAYKLLEGLKVSIDSPVVKAMRATRIKWVSDLMLQGMTIDQVKNAINDFYLKQDKASPFDFLRREYKPPLRVDNGAAYRAATRRRNEARRITRGFYAKPDPKPRRGPYRPAYMGW